jgi:prophage regulatory protein
VHVYTVHLYREHVNSAQVYSAHMTATMPTVELVGPAELGLALGVSRTRLAQITARPDFPAPVAELTMGKVWDFADVRRWAKATGRTLHPLPTK